MKKILSILLIIIMANTLGQAQEKECSLKQPNIPKDFFNSENYIPSCDYDSVCIATTSTVFFRSPYRWRFLYEDYYNSITAIGVHQVSYIEFDANGGVCFFPGVRRFGQEPVLINCGVYKLDSSNGLLYIRWDKSDNSSFQEDVVCRICYYTANESKTRYKEVLQLSRYIGATWDMSLEEIEERQTTPLFETLVRNRGI